MSKTWDWNNWDKFTVVNYDGFGESPLKKQLVSKMSKKYKVVSREEEELWDLVSFLFKDDKKTDEWFHSIHQQFNTTPFNMCKENRAAEVLKYVKYCNSQKTDINNKTEVKEIIKPIKPAKKKSLFHDDFFTTTVTYTLDNRDYNNWTRNFINNANELQRWADATATIQTIIGGEQQTTTTDTVGFIGEPLREEQLTTRWLTLNETINNIENLTQDETR